MIFRTRLVTFLIHHQNTLTHSFTARSMMSSSSAISSINSSTIFQSIQEAQEHVFKNIKSCSSSNSNIYDTNDDGHENLYKVITTPCGELKCQHDSSLSTLSSANVVAYAAYNNPTVKKNKNEKKNKKKQKNSSDPDPVPVPVASINNNTSNYLIVLSDSIFFPEGGGQPSDRGLLTIEKKMIEKNNDAREETIVFRVNDAQNVKGICLLTCTTQKSMEDVQSILSSSIATTTTTTNSNNSSTCTDTDTDSATMEENDDDTSANEATSKIQVTQELDWDKRVDGMTQHSSQHLISAVALSEFGLDTVSFSLRPDSLVSYIDFAWDTDSSDNSYNDNEYESIFAKIETIVNEHIRCNLSMKPTWLDTDNDDESLQNKEGLRSRLLPDGLTGKKIRLVEIDGIDLNTCCGTHVTNLSQLQMIKFFRVEKFKSNIVRVFFSSRERLMKILQGGHVRNVMLMNKLSCTEDKITERVQSLLEDKKVKEKEVKDLKEKLCKIQAKEIREELEHNDNIAVVDLGYNIDMGYMTMLSNEVLGTAASKEDDATILFVGSSGDTASSQEDGAFLLIGNNKFVDKIGKDIAVMFGGRGGGKNGKFQGKGTKLRSAFNEVKDFMMKMK
mmetsp:Transcript_14116/g.16408  ORF Transcript_14116/g.16408 Transcript_14116/m.16408 type:complete len:616 (+) Transcript_14116:13-1860(+)